MRIAFFTGGTHGAGHAVRGLALRRGLERRGFRGEIRLLGPSAAPWSPGFERLAIVEEDLRDPSRAKESALARALAAYRPDLLLVDMFWAPLRHVLPLAGCEAWLLLRSFPPKWLVGPRGHPFDIGQYARRIAIEPLVEDSAEITDRVDPIVIANHDEQQPPGALRTNMNIPEAARVVAVVHAGNPGEIASLVPATGRGEAQVTFDLHAGSALFPACEWLRDADVIHAAAGYNTFWEACWLGYAPRTRFTAMDRRNDAQSRRLDAAPHVMKENGADAIARLIG